MRHLRQRRKLCGFTQFELARATGLPPWKITFAETGRCRLTSEEIEKIKGVLARRAEEIASALAAA